MQNRNQINENKTSDNPVPSAEDQVLTDQQLDKLIHTLLRIDDMDDRPLYLKLRGKIAERQAARRRKQRWIISSAACAAALVLFAVVRLSGDRDAFTGPLAEEDGVRLIVSDGRNYTLSGSAGNLFMEDGAVLKAEEGTLFIEAPETEAPHTEPSYHTLEVPKGMQYDLVLSDGTKVWLNSDTRLRFPAAFTAAQRRVFIEGEAYFEVAYNPDKPFVVEVGTQRVTVLGTAFNVNAYEHNSSIQTTLFSGSVKVNHARSGQEQMLVPGQQASLDRVTGDISVAAVDLADVLAWRVNIIHLEKRTLEEIADYMAKIYNVEFRFMDDSARRIRFRGNVTRSENIEEVLERIGEVGNVKFKNNSNEIEIYME